MKSNRVFNALNAGLSISTKYKDLFFDTAWKGDLEIITYYNENGKLHNEQGPAIVHRAHRTSHSGVKTVDTARQYFYVNGIDRSAEIHELINAGAIGQHGWDEGCYNFDAADQFTIAMALN